MQDTDRDEFVLTLDGESSPHSRQLLRWAYGLLGLSFIAQGLAREPGGFLSALFIVLGVGAVLFALLYPKLALPRYLRYHREGIEGRVAFGKKVSLRWDEIADVEISMFALTIRMKGGRQIPVDLSALTYKQHKVDIPRVIALVQAKRITVKPS
jgi:hypothetical protein